MKKTIIIICLIFFLLSLTMVASSPLTNAPKIHWKNGQSTNWAGYAVITNPDPPQRNIVSEVKGSWIVPSVNCSSTPTAYASFWIGIDGYSSNTVEQIGTSSECHSGTPRYYVWYEMYPKLPVIINMTVSPGDTMSAEVKYLGQGSNFQLSIADTTTGTTFSTIEKSKRAKRSSAEWIAEAPSSGSVLPLANFGTVYFQNAQATINGVTGSINNPGWLNDAITMVTPSGVVKAHPSSLSTDGKNFSVTWQHS